MKEENHLLSFDVNLDKLSLGGLDFSDLDSFYKSIGIEYNLCAEIPLPIKLTPSQEILKDLGLDY